MGAAAAWAEEEEIVDAVLDVRFLLVGKEEPDLLQSWSLVGSSQRPTFPSPNIGQSMTNNNFAPPDVEQGQPQPGGRVASSQYGVQSQPADRMSLKRASAPRLPESEKDSWPELHEAIGRRK